MTRLPETTAAGVDFAVVLVGLGNYGLHLPHSRTPSPITPSARRQSIVIPGSSRLYPNPRFSALLRRMKLVD